MQSSTRALLLSLGDVTSVSAPGVRIVKTISRRAYGSSHQPHIVSYTSDALTRRSLKVKTTINHEIISSNLQRNCSSASDERRNKECSQCIRKNISVSISMRSLFDGLFSDLNLILRRFAHTDVRFPNFDEYRHDATLDCNKAARETEDERRVVPQMIYYGVGGVLALMTAKESVQKMVAFKGMACDQVAQAFTIVNMDEIPEGQTKTYEWQGKPVFVKHRTAHEIEEMKAVNISQLRHPESDSQRVKRAEWLVVVGVCTHLGCVPSPHSDEFVGGYKCPCHGAYFDASGRIRKGPAPLNLRVPTYRFKGNQIIIGSKPN